MFLLSFLAILLCGCSDYFRVGEDDVFTINSDGNLVSPSGVEYTYLANETELIYLGESEFMGGGAGEVKSSYHLDSAYQIGVFATTNDDNDNLLIRIAPDSEWFSIYRKASLPPFDFSLDNCIRLEFIRGYGFNDEDSVHPTCDGGIVDKAEIEELFKDVKSQQNPEDAGLYELVRNSDGILENCAVCGVCFF